MKFWKTSQLAHRKFIYSRWTNSIRNLLSLNIFPRVKRKDRWVLSRTACLGNDVYDMLDLNTKRINLQKTRIEALTRNKSSRWLIPREIKKVIVNPSIQKLVYEQGDKRWRKLHAPEFILMDTFSELTDQEFGVAKTSYRFYCNYGDLLEIERESGSIINLGLIDESKKM